MRWKLGIAFVFVAAAVIAADHPIDDPAIGQTWRNAGAPAIAPLGSGFLTIWREVPAAGGDFTIRAIRVDADGKPIDAASFPVGPHAVPGFPWVAVPSTDGVIVAWAPTLPSGTRVYRLTRIDAGGHVTQLPATLSGSFVGMAAGNDSMLAVSEIANGLAVTLLDLGGNIVRAGVPLTQGREQFDAVRAAGNGFLVEYTGWGDGRVRVVPVAPGAVRDGTVVPVVDQSTTYLEARYPNLAVNGDHAMAMWMEDQRVRARPLTLSGAPLTAVDLGTFSTIGTLIPFGDGFLTTLTETLPDYSQNLVVARLTAAGDLVASIRTKLQASGYPTVVAAASSGSKVVLAWSEPQPTIISRTTVVTAPLLDASIGPKSIVSLAPAGDQHVHALFATGSGAVAVWSEAGPSRRVMAGRIDPVGVPLDPAGFPLRNSPLDQTNVSAAFNGNELAVAWIEASFDSVRSSFRMSLDVAVVSKDNLALPRVVRMADGVPADTAALAWDGEEWVVVWQTATGTLAAVRLTRAGDPIDSVPIPLTTGEVSPYIGDWRPNLSWNGSEFLLVWERVRLYNPIIGIGEMPPDYVPDLSAQKLTRNLSADGARIDVTLAPGSLTNNAVGASDADVAFSNGMWLVAWNEINPAASGASYARIDASGARLDPVNGRRSALSGTTPVHVAASRNGWILAGDQQFFAIAPNGDAALTGIVSPGTLEAFTFDAPAPLLGYTVTGDDTRAFLHVIASRRRVAH